MTTASLVPSWPGAAEPGAAVIGLTVSLPEPWAAQVRLVRAAAGDPLSASVPPHITLLPPTAVPEGELDAVIAHVARVAAAHAPFVLATRGTDTFRPVSPVVFLRVTEGADELDALQRDVRTAAGPLDVPLRFPFHPHVTLAHEVDDSSLDEAERAGRDIAVELVVAHLDLYRLAADSSWQILSGPPLGGPPAA